MALDEIYIVGTIRTRKHSSRGFNQASYRILTEGPRKLAQNEFCYHLEIPIVEEWKTRIHKKQLEKIIPSMLPGELTVREGYSAKSTAEQVMNPLTGK